MAPRDGRTAQHTAAKTPPCVSSWQRPRVQLQTWVPRCEFKTPEAVLSTESSNRNTSEWDLPKIGRFSKNHSSVSLEQLDSMHRKLDLGPGIIGRGGGYCRCASKGAKAGALTQGTWGTGARGTGRLWGARKGGRSAGCEAGSGGTEDTGVFEDRGRDGHRELVEEGGRGACQVPETCAGCRGARQDSQAQCRWKTRAPQPKAPWVVLTPGRAGAAGTFKAVRGMSRVGSTPGGDSRPPGRCDAVRAAVAQPCPS